jgi:hypothetical protein
MENIFSLRTTRIYDHLQSTLQINLLKEFYLIENNSPLKVNRLFGGTCSSALLVNCFMLGSILAYSAALMMEATCFSETSDDVQRTTRRYIPEDRTLHNHRCDNFKA